MKLQVGLALTALTSVALAAYEPAQVYLIRKQSQSNSAPSITRQTTRQILLQRLGADQSGFLREIPDGKDQEEAISYINELGKTTPSLFSQTTSSEPAQLVLMIEGLGKKELEDFENSMRSHKRGRTFVVDKPPSASANSYLFEQDLVAAGVKPSGCKLEAAFNPYAPTCWDNNIFVEKYDLKKSPSDLDTLIENIPSLFKLANNGDMEAMLVMMPESSRSSSVKQWSSNPILHRRALRDAETVIAEDTPEESTQTVTPGEKLGAHVWAAAPKGPIPACFQSFNSCDTQTNSCSGHGKCVDKYSRGDASEKRADGEAACWVCKCLATEEHNDGKASKGRKTAHWGGNICQKKDVSVPFFMFAGFTIAFVGVITFTISMLFNVGEEKLPGVIGAGVSRNK